MQENQNPERKKNIISNPKFIENPKT